MAANISVRLEIKNEKVKEDFSRIVSTMEGFQIQRYSDDPWSCHIWVLEIGEDVKEEFRTIEAIRGTEGREVFLTSSRLDSDLLLQALRAGAKEFFPQPIKKDDVRNAFLRFKDQASGRPSAQARKRGQIINVVGGKGGVGTTTVAVNLAASLAQSEAAPLVVLIDMNLLFGEIPIFLGLESSFNWGEVARDISRVDSTYLMSILSKHSSGIYVLPSPTALEVANMATPEVIEKLLRELQEVFDYVVIDGGQSLDDVSLKILELSHVVLLIVILSLPCLTNVKKLLWTFQKLGYPQSDNVRVIITRHHKNSEISLKEAEKTLKKEVFWSVPNDYLTTISAINRGKILTSVAPATEISKNFRGLAAKFNGNGAGNEAEKKDRTGIREKWLGAWYSRSGGPS